MASEEAVERYPYPQEEPATLRAQARTIANLGQLLLDTHGEVDDKSLTMAESWRSDTATRAVADVKVLSEDMKGDSDRLAGAAAAITTYVGHVEDARSEVDGIRKKYDDAVLDRAEANRNPPDWVDHRFEHEEWRESNATAFDNTVRDLDSQHDGVLSTLTTRSRPAVTELDAVLARFVGANPPVGQGLGEVAFERASQNLSLTGDTRHEFHLRQAGLLTGPTPEGYYAEWLENAERQGVEPGVIVQIAREHDIDPEDFEVLNGLEEITDPEGKSFFLLPDGISGDDARKAVLMTFILNAGTDYGEGTPHDFEPEPYSSAYVEYIKTRQEANDWSYNDDVDFVHGNGGRLVTTPNGILMGLGGNWLQDKYSLNGGTTWGDIFMVNVDDPADAAQVLRDAVRSGRATYQADDGTVYQGNLDLDRLLHHEERHSYQWAAWGYGPFAAAYLAEGAGEGIINFFGGDYHNWFEKDAGLSDGGYS